MKLLPQPFKMKKLNFGIHSIDIFFIGHNAPSSSMSQQQYHSHQYRTGQYHSGSSNSISGETGQTRTNSGMTRSLVEMSGGVSGLQQPQQNMSMPISAQVHVQLKFILSIYFQSHIKSFMEHRNADFFLASSHSTKLAIGLRMLQLVSIKDNRNTHKVQVDPVLLQMDLAISRHHHGAVVGTARPPGLDLRIALQAILPCINYLRALAVVSTLKWIRVMYPVDHTINNRI